MDGWIEGLAALSGERLSAMEFLRDHLLESDRELYPFELFLEFADHALGLRETVPWCGALDGEIFRHYVLFPRVNDEDLSFHRRVFFECLWPRVRDLPTVEDAVMEVNRWCREIASYALTDERTASPLTVFRCGSGRCGEESAFLVSALRSVGIPARQVYVPRWSHCDDNHAWVEALCGGVWRFLGACEPEPELDRGWFNTVASRAVLVRSRLFGEGSSPLHGERLGREGGVVFYNQTARYAPVTRRVFRATAGGGPAPGAVFRLQILNEASFHTVATLTADENGEAAAMLGAGTLHVRAALGELSAQGDCEGDVTLALSPAPARDAGWRDFDFHAAGASARVTPLTAPQREWRSGVRREADRLRKARIDSFFTPDREHPEWDGLLLASRGNCGELLGFLRGESPRDRERFLRTLTLKDLRDTPGWVLEHHFSRLPPRDGAVPEDIYWSYVACPRIGTEKLAPWRGAEPPELPAPEGDAKTVASLRCRGVPARLRPLDGAPEVWEGGSFRPVFPKETGVLRVKCPGEPAYRQKWSLSRLTPEDSRLLDLREARWEDGAMDLTLPAGFYRIVTSCRLPDGGQAASRRELELPAGARVDVELRLRGFDLRDALFSQKLPPLPAVTAEGREVQDVFRLGTPTAVLWPEEGAEPTEHLLSELAGMAEALGALPAITALMLRSPESPGHPSAAALLRKLPGAYALFDDWSYDLEDIARRLGLDPDSPPLSVVCDGRGRAVYAESGYRVGAAEALLAALRLLCGGEDENSSKREGAHGTT